MGVIRYQADASAAVRAAKDLDRALDQVEKGAEDTAKGLTKAERAAKRFAEQADPAKRYERQMRDVARAVKDGGLEQDKALILARRYGNQLDRVGDSGKRAFDPAVLANYASRFAGPVALATTMLNRLQAIRQEQDAVAAKQLAISGEVGTLFQLAGGDRAKGRALVDAADKTFAEGFVPTRNDAVALTFQLESSGQLGERRFFSKLGAVDNSAELARTTSLIAAGFKGGDDVGSPRELVSKAFAGAGAAPGVEPSGISQAVAQVAPLARRFDLTDEETFAAISRVAEVTGNASEAATQVRSVFTALTQRGLADDLRGQGFEALVRNVEERGLNQQELGKFLGGSEAARGFGALRDRQAFRRRVADIERAQATGLADQAIANAVSNPLVESSIQKRRGEAQLELAREEAGQRANRQDGANAATQARLLRETGSEFYSSTVGAIGEVIQFTGLPGAPDTQGEVLREILGELRTQTQALEETSVNPRRE